MNDTSSVHEVLKILRADEGAELVQHAVFKGAPVDLEDGYIHLSTYDQAPETAARHFAGVDGLWLACIESARLGESLRWEPSRGGALFPHLYRELRVSDILWLKPLPLGVTGLHQFPAPST